MITNVRMSAGVAAGVGLLCVLSTTAGAFGNAGHQIIGTLAELHLGNSRAMTEVRTILRGNETLADAAVWPDRIKDALYEDEDTALFRLNHPAHDTYHYANLPFQASEYALSVPGARPSDIVQATRDCIQVLRTGTGPFTRREALRLLVHYLGDMHQPLHVGNGFVGAREPLGFVVPKGPTGWRSTLGGNLRLRSNTPLTAEKISLKEANGKNKNPFFQTDEISRPVISPEAALKTGSLKKTFLYDIQTTAGQTLTLRAK